jgi:hypothetical protein
MGHPTSLLVAMSSKGPVNSFLEETMKTAQLIFILAIFLFAGCSTDADIASYNLSKSAYLFELNRWVVFYNVITNDYILSVEGRCSINVDGMDNQLELTCKTGPSTYKKHFLGLSDNVTYFAEQLEPAAVDVYRYRVIFKPASILPNVDLSTK